MTQNQSYGTCPFCRFVIIHEEELKKCPGCQVSHHQECWQYNGGCTTFACNGKPISHEAGHLENVSLDELIEEYSGNKLVINIEDLQDEWSDHGIDASKLGASQKVSSSGSFSIDAVKPLLLAGLLGGFITWILAGEYFDFEYYASYQRFDMILIEIMAFSALMGGLVGACLGSVEGITSKVPSKAVNGIIIGLIIGVLGAALGAILGEAIYEMFDGSNLEDIAALALLRAIFWGLVGLFIGLGQGISAGGKEKAKNGLIGGICGGFIGGLLFEMSFALFESAGFSALVAISIFGGSIGISIGMVQEYRKEAWFRVLQGATAGKEYIIQSEKTIIGSHPNCEIVLIGDSAISPRHAEVKMENARYSIYTLSDLSTLSINNKKVRRQLLHNGDKVKIGTYVMVFSEKTA